MDMYNRLVKAKGLGCGQKEVTGGGPPAKMSTIKTFNEKSYSQNDVTVRSTILRFFNSVLLHSLALFFQ